MAFTERIESICSFVPEIVTLFVSKVGVSHLEVLEAYNSAETENRLDTRSAK